jgi:hypothetical protein
VRSIPLFDKEGEFQGELGASTNSLYIDASYAFTDKIAASINGNVSYGIFSNRYDLFTSKKSEPPAGGYYISWPDYRGNFSHYYGELSLGGINLVPNFPMKLEAFGGMGFGRAEDVDLYDKKNHYKSDYYHFFGQANFGLKHRIVEAGVSLRLGFSHFIYNANYNKGFGVYTSLKHNIEVLHLEPMLFVRVGGKSLKAVFRAGVNLAVSLNPNNDFAGFRGFQESKGKLDYTIFHFSVGISYRFEKKKNSNN